MKLAKALAGALAGGLSLLALTATAHAGAGVNGISEQQLDGHWTPRYTWWLKSLPDVRYARRNVPWDVADGTHRMAVDEAAALTVWLAAVRSLGLQPLISFNHSVCADASISGSASLCTPTPEKFEAAFRAFRARWPEVTEFTPWNEPNHNARDDLARQLNPVGTTVSGAPRAAQYFLKMKAACESPPTGLANCAAVAGDITDEVGGDADAAAYLTAYKFTLGGVAPAIWAFHGYGYANRATTTLRGLYDSVAPAAVWITEVGAYRCLDGVPKTDADNTQRTAALRIAQLKTWPNVDRNYYYSMAVGRRRYLGNDCLEYDDTSLVTFDDGGTTTVPDERPSLKIIRNGAPMPMLFKNGTWKQRFTFETADQQNRTVLWGQAGDQPVFGDWNADGVKTPGVFRTSTGVWWLTDDPQALDPRRATSFRYGTPGDTALVGDWNGDGRDTVGVRNGNTFFLSNTNDSGPSTYGFAFGDPGDPIAVGNWDGDRSGRYVTNANIPKGTDGIAIVKGDAWYAKNTLSGSGVDTGWFYGAAGDKPVAGDWNGDGADSPGVYRGVGGFGAWFLGNNFGSGNYTSFWSRFDDGSSTPLAG